MTFNPQPKPERQPKYCKKGGCTRPKFSHGYCKSHANTEIYIPKMKAKMIIGDEKLERWYKFIYEKFKGICQEDGRQLPFDKKFIHHILPKAKMPYYKYDERNGILINLQAHSTIEHSAPQFKEKLKCYPTILKTQIELYSECGMDVKADELRIELAIINNINQIKIANEIKS